MTVGDKVKFKEEKQRYTVQAIGSRYAVCTKPLNCQRTVLYTVIDFEKKIRGTENLVFAMGAETREECQEMLVRLESGDTEVSYRNFIPLNISEVE